MAQVNVFPEQKSGYRWVMAVIVAIIMTTSFMSLTAFGVAAPKNS